MSQFLLGGNSERQSPGEDGVETGSAPSDAVTQDALIRAMSFVPPKIRHAIIGSIGSEGPEDGVIRDGIQALPQRFSGHRAGIEHMTE